MAIYKRKKNDTKAVPPEVKQYYASEHRERVGLAWLIAFLSLIVTVLVVAGLFFGGRWAYRKIANSDNKPTTSDNLPKSQGSSQGNSDQSKSNDLQPATKPPTDSGEVSVDNGDNSSSNSPTGSNNSSNKRSKSTESGVPAETNMTDTGPGSTLTIFVAVSVLAYLIHWQYQKRRHAAASNKY